jgi:hypothetical protein
MVLVAEAICPRNKMAFENVSSSERRTIHNMEENKL